MLKQRDKMRTVLHLLAGTCLGIAMTVCGDMGPPPMMADSDMGMGMGGGPMATPMKVITADQDAGQIVTGMVDDFPLVCQFADPYDPIGHHCGKAIDGPFVLTDLRATGGGGASAVRVQAFVADKDEQLTMRAFRPRWSTGTGTTVTTFPPISGMRLLVKAGEKLYVSVADINASPQPALYSGFRPY